MNCRPSRLRRLRASFPMPRPSNACINARASYCWRWDFSTTTTPTASTTTCATSSPAPISTRARPRSSSASSGRSSGRFGARRVRLRQTLADDPDERIEVERFEDRVADGVGWDLVDAAFAGGGEDDDVRAMIAVAFADLLDEFVTVEPRHHEVEEDQVVSRIALQPFQSRRPILG